MSTFATEAADPLIGPDRLAELTRDHPETRAAAALNPVAYAGLLDWLGTLGDPVVDDALRSRDTVLGGRASDLSTPPAELAVLAAEMPTLCAAIAANPSTYAELRKWITAQSTPAPSPADDLPAGSATSSSSTSFLDVNYLTLTSGIQKIWLVADYFEANDPTTDRVGDIQIGSGAHITEEFCG